MRVQTSVKSHLPRLPRLLDSTSVARDAKGVVRGFRLRWDTALGEVTRRPSRPWPMEKELYMPPPPGLRGPGTFPRGAPDRLGGPPARAVPVLPEGKAGSGECEPGRNRVKQLWWQGWVDWVETCCSA